MHSCNWRIINAKLLLFVRAIAPAAMYSSRSRRILEKALHNNHVELQKRKHQATAKWVSFTGVVPDGVVPAQQAEVNLIETAVAEPNVGLNQVSAMVMNSVGMDCDAYGPPLVPQQVEASLIETVAAEPLNQVAAVVTNSVGLDCDADGPPLVAPQAEISLIDTAAAAYNMDIPTAEYSFGELLSNALTIVCEEGVNTELMPTRSSFYPQDDATDCDHLSVLHGSESMLHTDAHSSTYTTASGNQSRTVVETENVRDEPVAGGRRKRKRNVGKWKKNKIKLAREAGHAYVGHTGKNVSAKVSSAGMSLCSEKCRIKCNDITDDVRSDIFHTYYGMDEESKNAYIFGCIITFKPQTVHTSAASHRTFSAAYYITVDGSRKKVCKRAFCTLHGIGAAKLRHVCEQVASGQHAAHPSQRGKHASRPKKLPDDVRQRVIQHISSFPSEPSHYSRSCNSGRQYLSPILTINKMYDQYKLQCDTAQVHSVSSSMYREIFNTEFNLGFGSPKSDTCNMCDQKCEASEAVAMHKERADLAFKMQAQDKALANDPGTDQQVHFITFDLQKTLPLPKLSTSVAFYLRQVWLYNLGVHLSSTSANGAYFQVWTEDEAGRGCEEVCSALLTFLEVSGIKDGQLIAWSDSCAGQNKNFFTLCFWQWLIKQDRFSRIDHKFPEPGHSFMDSDRDFAHIEQEVKKHTNIYSVDEYIHIMSTCVRKPLNCVTRMAHRFYAMKSLPQLLGLKNVTLNADGQKIAFRDNVRWLRVEKFGEYQYKDSLDESAPWKTVRLVVCGSAPDTEESAVMSLHKQQSCLPIKKNKWNDIQKQLPYIPESHRGYYRNLKPHDDMETTAAVVEGSGADAEHSRVPAQVCSYIISNSFC